MDMEYWYYIYLRSQWNNHGYANDYELVQVKWRKLSPPRVPHATDSVLECHIFCIILTAMNSGRGWRGHVFCSGPRTGASGENVPPPTTGLQNGQQRSSVSVGRKVWFSRFYLNEPVPGTPRQSYKEFRANVRTCDCVGPISSHIYHQKSTFHWN